MPINKRDDGWYWGSKGPFKSKDKAEEVQRAAHASGYQKLMKQTPDYAQQYQGLAESTRKNRQPMIDTKTMKEYARKKAQRQGSKGRKKKTESEQDVFDAQTEAEKKVAKWRKKEKETTSQAFAEGMMDPAETFGKLLKEGDGGGIGTVAVSSDPGVFTDTYGARKQKVLNRKNSGTKKSKKSGPQKLDDFLQHTVKSLDDESFLVELIEHVGEELSKAGEGPHGTYTPYNERPFQPAFPQETKRKGRNDKVSRYPTTENTVPVNTGAGELGQSKVPQETVLAPPGVDDARNMNRSVERKGRRKAQSLPTGAFLTPGNESGMNFQAMQKMPTHGNTTANSPKQFSTERPQEPYVERKPRLDPNSDIEQNEFTGNVESIKDEDKAKKGRNYENNKDSNNINSTRIEQYSVHGGSPLQLSSTNMPVGLDSLKRDSDDAITEPDDENTEELQENEEKEIPADTDIVESEKGGLVQGGVQQLKAKQKLSAVQAMQKWLNEF